MAQERENMNAQFIFLMQVLVFQLLFLLLICSQHATGMQSVYDRTCIYRHYSNRTVNPT